MIFYAASPRAGGCVMGGAVCFYSTVLHKWRIANGSLLARLPSNDRDIMNSECLNDSWCAIQ
jgi:hypothetical protein